MTFDWEGHKKHRAAVAADVGQWVGLVDEWGIPMMDLPLVKSLKAPEVRLSPSPMEATMLIRSPRGVTHPVADALLAKDIGRVDVQGKLVPVTGKTRFVAVERPGGVRRTYRITHSPATIVGDSLTTMTIHATDLLRLLSGIPAASAPLSWTGKWTRFERDWAGPENIGQLFAKPRDLQDIKMVTVADGATMQGPAEDVIRRLIDESIQAAARAVGMENPQLKVSPVGSGKESPKILLRPTDKYVWDEISSLAMASGIKVTADMWWPGDPPPQGLEVTKPTVIFAVLQT